MLVHRQVMLWCGCGGSSAIVVGERGNKKEEAAARQLSWAQVEAMTGGFTSAVVGEGGFSTVYLARLKTGSLAAVKVHDQSSERAFRQELDALLRVRHHPHIVRLLGFCSSPHDSDATGGGVLVLEFAPNGNLHDLLHPRIHKGKGMMRMMAWARRVSVALQVARALAYLHDRCLLVHGDVKASNVLLDASMAARLCDFGSARAPDSHNRLLHGSPGYVDPHYLRSGVLTTKSDVYSFGVLLLELVTGVQPFCPDAGRRAVIINKPQIATTSTSSSRHLIGIGNNLVVDRRLGCRYDADEAAAMLALAAACVGDNPTLRPSMPDVVRTMEQNAQASIGFGTTGPNNLSRYPTTATGTMTGLLRNTTGSSAE